jgi:hypothetical protein
MLAMSFELHWQHIFLLVRQDLDMCVAEGDGQMEVSCLSGEGFRTALLQCSTHVASHHIHRTVQDLDQMKQTHHQVTERAACQNIVANMTS